MPRPVQVRPDQVARGLGVAPADRRGDAPVLVQEAAPEARIAGDGPIAERRSGGRFEARRVRGARAGRGLPPADAYDDAG